MYGFYRVSAAIPDCKVANIDFNHRQIISLVKKSDQINSSLVVFPELSLTGYTCGDLFHQDQLIRDVKVFSQKILDKTKDLKTIFVYGAPVLYKDKLYNSGIVAQSGKILGIIPKIFIPNYREYYEKRWFASGAELKHDTINFIDKNIPFSSNIIFSHGEHFRFSVEICEDLWSVIPPSSHHSISGATVIANLSASNEIVGKSNYRKDLVKQQSARCVGSYIYSSSGVNESTTDLVYSGHALIASNGSIDKESERFSPEPQIISSDIDCERLTYTRLSECQFKDAINNLNVNYRFIEIDKLNSIKNLNKKIDPHPFVPSDSDKLNLRSKEIFNIQSTALAKRLKHTKATKAVIGISGGIDSTLALLVVRDAFIKLNKNLEDIYAITMPGFGTSDKTLQNAIKLTRSLGIPLNNIDIKPACIQHLKDIEHDLNDHSIVYENVQARERTQILMSIANKYNGLVIGTGDLSEIALGWSTYNADHMSMYSVNCSIPKTLIRFIIKWHAIESKNNLKKSFRGYN